MRQCKCVHVYTHMTPALSDITCIQFFIKETLLYQKKVMCSDSSTPLVRIQSPWIATTHTSLNARVKETDRDRDGGKRGKIKNTLINRKGEVMQKTNRKVIFPSLHIYLCVNAVSCGHPPPHPQPNTHTRIHNKTHTDRERELEVLQDQSSLRGRWIFHVL